MLMHELIEWTGRKWIALCVIGGLGMTLSGCGTMGCAGFRAVYVSEDDVLTEGTARQLAANNENGYAQKCPGFTPKKRR